MTDESAIAAVRARRRAARENPEPAPDRRAEILAATERGLATTPLHDLSVAQIMEEAGIARGTFYAYFASKYEVVAALQDAVMVEMYDLLRPFVEREDGVDGETAIRMVLSESARLWHRHATVFRATHDHRHAVPELKDQWLRVTERFTDAVAAEIEREVKNGNAPKRRNSRRLAAALVWSSEHVFYVAGSGDDDNLPDEDATVDTLVQVWRGAIYG